MHVLLISSEEFLPPGDFLSGIFQKHQAGALRNVGCKVGILSIRQSLSVLMLLKAIIYRCLGLEINNELKNKSFKEMIILLWKKIFKISSFIRIEEIDGNSVFRIDGFYYFPPSPFLNHIGWLYAGKLLWKNYIKNQGFPDIIHAHNAVYAGILAREISRNTGIPYVITEHSSFVARKLEPSFLYPMIKKVYQQAASFFVVSSFLGQAIDRIFRDSTGWEELPNVLDPEIESTPLLFNLVNESQFVFLSIGTLIPIKNHDLLIDAFNLAFGRNKQVILMIAGDGELKEELQKKIADLNLKNQIFLLGKIDRSQVIQQLDQSHCLVLSSDFETFGVVLIEALSRGKPIVATACGGPDTIVNKSNGILCARQNISSLASALSEIKACYSDYNRTDIKNDALLKYGSFSFGNRLKTKYKKIISQND